MGSKWSKKYFYFLFLHFRDQKHAMIAYDEFLDKLGADTITDDNFQTLLSTKSKADLEDLNQIDLLVSMNTSLSLWIISSTCCTLSYTTINPLILKSSPRRFGNDSVEKFVQPKKKSLSFGPRQTYSMFKIENHSQCLFLKSSTGKIK